MATRGCGVETNSWSESIGCRRCTRTMSKESNGTYHRLVTCVSHESHVTKNQTGD